MNSKVKFAAEKGLPREILEKAVQLRDPLKTVFITLYTTGKPATATEIAQLTGKARAYINVRLNELVDMGLAEVTRKGKVKFYNVKSS